MHIRCGVTASIARFQFQSEQIGVRFPATELSFLLLILLSLPFSGRLHAPYVVVGW